MMVLDARGQRTAATALSISAGHGVACLGRDIFVGEYSTGKLYHFHESIFVFLKGNAVFARRWDCAILLLEAAPSSSS